jgi:hypothetical protein
MPGLHYHGNQSVRLELAPVSGTPAGAGNGHLHITLRRVFRRVERQDGNQALPLSLTGEP